MATTWIHTWKLEMFCIVATGDSVVASSRTIRFDGDSDGHLFSAELVRIRRFNFADIISSIRVFIGNNRECSCLIETKARKIACRLTIRM